MTTMSSPSEGPACSDVTVMREMSSSSEALACSEDTVMMTMPSSSKAPACSEDTAMMTMPSSSAAPACSEDVAMMTMPSPLESPACPENTIKTKMLPSFEAHASPGDMVVMMPSTSGVHDSSSEMKKDHNNLFVGLSGLGTNKKEPAGFALGHAVYGRSQPLTPYAPSLFTFTTSLFPSNKPMFSDTSSSSKTCKCHGVCSCTERKGPPYIRDDRFDEIMQEYHKRVEKSEGFDVPDLPLIPLLGVIRRLNLAENPKVVKLAKFAVRQQNRIEKKNQQGNKMKLMNVIKTTVQAVGGLMYYLSIEVMDAKVDKPKTYQA